LLLLIDTEHQHRNNENSGEENILSHKTQYGFPYGA
jgi:hypothetical protein